MGFEGATASKDMASSVLVPAADGAVVIGGWVGISGIGELPSVGKFSVPESPPSGPVYLHFKGPGNSV